MDPTSFSNHTKVLIVLDTLEKLALDIPNLLFCLSYGDDACNADPRVRAVRRGLVHSPLLPQILELWYNPPNRVANHTSGARPVLQDLALKWVVDICHDEFTFFHSYLKTNSSLSEAELLQTSFNEVSSEFFSKAVHLCSLLRSLASGRSGSQTHSRNPDQLVTMIIVMLAYHRVQEHNRFQQLLSIYWVACGVPSKAVALLHSIGLAMSASWVQRAIANLSKDAITRVRDWVADKPFAAIHDNVNIAFKVSSQRVANHNHFDSGTAMTILPLPMEFRGDWMNPTWRALRDNWIRTSEKPTLSWEQWDQSMRNSMPQVENWFIYHIQQFLLRNPELSDLRDRIGDSGLLKCPPSVDALPSGPETRTRQWPLPTVHIDESTHEGTSTLISKLLHIVGLDSPQHQNDLATARTIPWCGDQKTVGLMRHLRGFRGGDFNGFERMDWLVLMKGWFHEQMALQNQILWIHKGNIAGSGLARDIKTLARIGLAPKNRQQKPDFHHLHELILHALEAHILDCWLEVSGSSSMAKLTTCAETWTGYNVLKLSRKIYQEYVKSPAGLLPEEDENFDMAHRNAALFVRDGLIYWELACAIKEGDVGRMGNLIPVLLGMFVGGGNPLYAIELQEEMQLECNELTPEQVRLVRHHCWLANTKGARDSFFPMDQLQEHNIRSIKEAHRAAGANGSWEYLGKVSPLIPLLSDISMHIEKIFHIGSKGWKHASVDHHRDVKRLVEMYQTDRLHQRQRSRVSADGSHTDVLRAGCESLANKTHLMDWRNNREKYIHETTQVWDPPSRVGVERTAEPVDADCGEGRWESDDGEWEIHSEGGGEDFRASDGTDGAGDMSDMAMEWTRNVDGH